MILFCGEALIDMLPNASGQFTPHVGGAVANSARALARLGGQSALFWPISTDMFGRMIHDSLTQAGVDLTLAPRPDRPTTLAFADLSQGSARYSFYDEGSAGRGLARADLPKLPAQIDTLYFGGISLAAEPCGDSLEHLAHEAGDKAIVIDPNIRPSFVTDPDAYRARIARLCARADLIKVSEEDLDWLTPDPVGWLRGQRAAVCLTRGGAGATLYAGGAEMTLPAAEGQVVDTVGAGDVFNAALIHGLRQKTHLKALHQTAQADLQAALTLALRVAGLSVARAGAYAPTAEEVWG